MTATHVPLDRFEAIQPDIDMSTEEALGDPTQCLWSYKIGGHWYSCRPWSEVVDVANDVDDPFGAWLDVLPSLPLDAGVPVVYRDGARGIIFEITNGGTMAIVHYAYPVTAAVDARPFTQAVSDLRVNLDEAIGFGYVLRWAIHQRSIKHADRLRSMQDAHMGWEAVDIGDIARFALASVCRDICAEVSR